MALTVVRRGELGTVMVSWSAGLPGSSAVNGTITPEQGSFQMGPTDTSYQILLTVSNRTIVLVKFHVSTHRMVPISPS